MDLYTEVWRCETCGEHHDDPDIALECCPSEIYKCYLCTICGEEYFTIHPASQCCEEEKSSKNAPIVNPREMENVGQLRLIP